MKSQTMRKRLVGAVSALMMCVSIVPALPAGYAYAAGEENAAAADNGIPTVYIEIDENAEGYGTIEEMNDDEQHNVCCTGTVKIDVPDGYVSRYSGEALDDTKELKLEYIRGRGNSTWLLDKRPYKIKLDKSTDLLGMGKNKHWALLANRLDGSLMRNLTATYIAERLGLEYTPKMLPVDVVMNGEYLGSYTLSETVRIGSNRVDIDELTEEDNAEPEVTGGYLFSLEQEQVPATTPDLFATERGVLFKFDTPSFLAGEEGTAEQRAYITDYLQKTENAVFGEGDADWTEYIDAESAANYWWLEEFILNSDAFWTDSTYFYKKRDGKLYFGPVWDSDLSLGLGKEEHSLLNSAQMIWLDHLRTFDADYQQLLLERWKVLDGIAQELTRDGGYIDQLAAGIEKTFAADRERWGMPPQEIKETGDLAKETADLKEFIDGRREYINSHLSDLTKARATASFVADGETVRTFEVDYSMPVPELPEAPEKEGFYFLGWQDEDGNLLEMSPGIEGDMVFTAKYIPDEEVIRGEAIYFEKYDIWRAMNEGECSVMWAVVPYDAQDKKISWSVSDPDTAEINDNGMVFLHAERETVITVTGELSNGVKNSYRIHFYDSEKTEFKDIKGIELESDRLDLKVGEYGQISYTCSPEPCMAFISISSDNMDVAEVDGQTGVVYAKSPGTAVITVEDSFEGVSAQYTVYVTDGSEPRDSSLPDESSSDVSEPEESSLPDESGSDISEPGESSLPDESLPDSEPDSSASETDTSVSVPDSSSAEGTKGGDNPKTGAAAGALLAVTAAAAVIAIRKRTDDR